MLKFKYLVIISAALLACSAGFFSIMGIGKLFIGAPISSMVMAGGLELGKLVTVSFVYRYWKHITGSLKAYFVVAAIVLMCITTTGVYGYLSAAYATSASGIQVSQNQITLYNTHITSIDSSIARLQKRSTILESVRQQQENRLDSLIGKRGLVDQQRLVATSDKSDQDIQNQITTLELQRDSLRNNIIYTQNGISTNGKLGTFYYVAQSLGVSLDAIVRWFILAIVIVFDPLSVSLVLAYQIIIKSENIEELDYLPFPPLTTGPPIQENRGEQLERAPSVLEDEISPPSNSREISSPPPVDQATELLRKRTGQSSS